jgi:acyl-CoA thioesterase-1
MLTAPILRFSKPLSLLGLLLLLLGACQNPSDKPANTTTIPTNDSLAQTTDTDSRAVILCLGNSITAGYGLDPEEAFPALLQKRIDSLGLPYRVLNRGISGETTAGGKARMEWILQQKISILLIELGGNDGLRGLSPDETRQNLIDIIQLAKAQYPQLQVVLGGMQVPPNMGPDYAQAFAQIYPQVAQQTGAVLIPFILEGVGGVPELNLPDGIHPTAEGHQLVAATVWQALAPLLEAR